MRYQNNSKTCCSIKNTVATQILTRDRIIFGQKNLCPEETGCGRQVIFTDVRYSMADVTCEVVGYVREVMSQEYHVLTVSYTSRRNVVYGRNIRTSSVSLL